MNNIDLDINDMQMYAEKFQRSHNNRQKFIIVGTLTFDSSEFEKVFQSARDEGCGIAIFKLSDDGGIDIEHVQNQEAFGISKASFEQLSFIDDCYPIKQLNSTMQEQLCDAISIEETLLTIADIKNLKKKKTFQEKFGYVKRKFR